MFLAEKLNDSLLNAKEWESTHLSSKFRKNILFEFKIAEEPWAKLRRKEIVAKKKLNELNLKLSCLRSQVVLPQYSGKKDDILLEASRVSKETEMAESSYVRINLHLDESREKYSSAMSSNYNVLFDLEKGRLRMFSMQFNKIANALSYKTTTNASNDAAIFLENGRLDVCRFVDMLGLYDILDDYELTLPCYDGHC